MPYEIKGEADVETGFGLPRHTTASRLLYTPPRSGYQVFDITLNQTFTWDGFGWFAASGIRVFYQLPFSFQDVLPDNTIVARTQVARPYVLEAQIASTTGNSRGSVATAPQTGITTFNILRNGTIVGIASVSIGSTDMSFSIPANVMFLAGDLLEIATVEQHGAEHAAVTLRVFDPNSGQDIPANLTELFISNTGGSVSGPIISTSADIVDDDPDGTLVTKKYVDGISSNSGTTAAETMPRYLLIVGDGSTSYTISFTLSTPPAGRSNNQVFVNGVKQVEGISNAYTITNNMITFNTNTTPAVDDNIEIYGFG